MGASTSVPEIAQMCSYNKEDFNKKLNILRDSHSLTQYYASVLLSEKMPITLKEYINYNEESEDYFNTRRKETIDDLQSANPKIKNYYDFYDALNNLQNEYERNDISENERRSKITDVFNVSYTIMRLLIEDLWESCDVQNPQPLVTE